MDPKPAPQTWFAVLMCNSIAYPLHHRLYFVTHQIETVQLIGMLQFFFELFEEFPACCENVHIMLESVHPFYIMFVWNY
jgi:hypothetical protein